MEKFLSDRPLVIGICGDIGAGKDTIAEHLMERGFIHVAWSDELKETILRIYNLERRLLFGTQADKNEQVPHLGTVVPSFAMFGGPWPSRVGEIWTGRYLAEFVGTDAFRRIYSRTWVDFLTREIAEERFEGARVNDPPLHVISGCRFADEFHAIQVEMGGVMWRVERTDAEDTGERTGHSSDEGWRTLPVDGELRAATGEIPWLLEQVDVLLGEINQ